MEELHRLQKQQVAAPCPFVFSTKVRTSATGVSKGKLRIDAHIASAHIERGNSLPFEPWVFHDLLHAQATALAEAGYDEGIVDRIQNHEVAGSRSSASCCRL